MKNLLFLLCVATATLLTADFAEAGGGSKGTVRLRNNAGSQPVRVWVLTQPQAAGLTGAETKLELHNMFGGGVNLNGNKHHNFKRPSGNYVAVVFHTEAFDPLPGHVPPAAIANLGFRTVPLNVTAGRKQRVDFNAVIDGFGNRLTNYDGPTPY